jgi:hypothetical protein
LPVATARHAEPRDVRDRPVEERGRREREDREREPAQLPGPSRRHPEPEQDRDEQVGDELHDDERRGGRVEDVGAVGRVSVQRLEAADVRRGRLVLDRVAGEVVGVVDVQRVQDRRGEVEQGRHALAVRAGRVDVAVRHARAVDHHRAQLPGALGRADAGDDEQRVGAEPRGDLAEQRVSGREGPVAGRQGRPVEELTERLVGAVEVAGVGDDHVGLAERPVEGLHEPGGVGPPPEGEVRVLLEQAGADLAGVDRTVAGHHRRRGRAAQHLDRVVVERADVRVADDRGRQVRLREVVAERAGVGAQVLALVEDLEVGRAHVDDVARRIVPRAPGEGLRRRVRLERRVGRQHQPGVQRGPDRVAGPQRRVRLVGRRLRRAGLHHQGADRA